MLSMKTISQTFILLVCFALISACSQEPGEPKNIGGEKLSVVALFATPIEEPWDGVIHKALLRAKDKFGIDYEYKDDIKANLFEKTLRSYADKGHDLIMGDAFSAEEAVRRVARDYPGTYFVFGSGLGPAEPNLSVFDNWIQEPAYLAGLIAGKLTKSNTIGIVGGYDIPEVNRIINAFKEGAKSSNQDVKVKIIFIGSWFDPPKAAEATRVLISNGADIFYAERDGVIGVCAKEKIPVFGNLLDQHRNGEEVVVSSVLWDMWPTVKHVIESIQSNTFTAENYAEWSMMAKGGARLAPFYSWEKKLDSEIKKLVSDATDKILTGRLRVPVIESTPQSD